MTHKDFSILLERRLKLTKNILDRKSKEYSTSEDKLHNFKEVARQREKHPCEALQGMLDKHLISYFDMLRDLQSGKIFTQDYLDEKFGDIINYFILQEAIFKEYGTK